MTTPDTARESELPPHLRLYDQSYFLHGQRLGKSGYDNYENCSGVLERWSAMLAEMARPTSVLDVGAAYGFVVRYFRERGVPAWGVEPSAWARSQVPAALQPYVHPGALPDLPAVITDADALARDGVVSRFDLVTCTEVLEHVPEDLVPASLQALADRTERLLVCLVMLEGPGADGDEGHICLKSRDWWEWQFTQTGLVRNEALEHWLNTHPRSVSMYWAGRFFVRERVPGSAGDNATAGAFARG